MPTKSEGKGKDEGKGKAVAKPKKIKLNKETLTATNSRTDYMSNNCSGNAACSDDLCQ